MDKKPKILLCLSMAVFGTVGIVRHYLPTEWSGFIASMRGFIGAVFLLLIMLILKKKPDFKKIGKNLFKLILSGIFIGSNWILFFESMNYTSVATSTLCYYMAPVFFVIISLIFFKERLNLKRTICVIVSFAGMVLVSGVVGGQSGGESNLKGVCLALGAALLYSLVTTINKTVTDISPYDKTTVQLLTAAIVVLPYSLIFEPFTASMFSTANILLLLLLGILHTSLAYAAYFASVEKVPAGTVAVLSYIDPVVAVLLSVLVLSEPLDIFGKIGAVLIIASAIAAG